MADAIFAEFGSSNVLVAAIEQLRSKGYRKLDAYTPYPVDAVTHALGLRRSRLPFVIFAGGMCGAALAYALQWYLVAYLYPLDVGGRPPHMPLAFMIITFEMGVLAAALTAFVSMLVRGRLLRLYDPLFDVEGIDRASVDRHWLRVDREDRCFDPEQSIEDLRATMALSVVHRGIVHRWGPVSWRRTM